LHHQVPAAERLEGHRISTWPRASSTRAYEQTARALIDPRMLIEVEAVAWSGVPPEHSAFG
jgi:hypothetical protein